MCTCKQWCGQESFKFEQIRFECSVNVASVKEQLDVQWSRSQILVSFSINIVGLNMKWLRCSGQKMGSDALKICSITPDWYLMAHFSVISPLCVFAPKDEGLTQKMASLNKCFVFYVYVPHRVDGVTGSTQAKKKKREKKWRISGASQSREILCGDHHWTMKNVCDTLTHWSSIKHFASMSSAGAKGLAHLKRSLNSNCLVLLDSYLA